MSEDGEEGRRTSAGRIQILADHAQHDGADAKARPIAALGRELAFDVAHGVGDVRLRCGHADGEPVTHPLVVAKYVLGEPGPEEQEAATRKSLGYLLRSLNLTESEAKKLL